MMVFRNEQIGFRPRAGRNSIALNQVRRWGWNEFPPEDGPAFIGPGSQKKQPPKTPLMVTWYLCSTFSTGCTVGVVVHTTPPGGKIESYARDDRLARNRSKTDKPKAKPKKRTRRKAPPQKKKLV